MVIPSMEWRSSKWLSRISDTSSRRSCICSLLLAASLPCLLLFMGSVFLAQDNKEKLLKWGLGLHAKEAQSIQCKNPCMPPGSETLPKGIVSNTTNLEMRPLWGFPKKSENTTSLFAVAAGIEQKNLVDKLVRKFLSSGFVVMAFHYDGVVDEWRDLEWSDRVIHVSAVNQTKWWFAKRFLHPDIVAEYDYVFLWDEDIEVEDFHPQRYLEIVKGEGLEISQPALDGKSEVHHQITARSRRTTVHRRIYKATGKADQCDGNSRSPPCTGWIELMAPVFSKAAWRCVWYMIQNDLIHAWGLDIRLGHCAQGDRTKNIGVVDSEYVVHYGLPTLGGHKNKINSTTGTDDEPPPHVEPPTNDLDGANTCDSDDNLHVETHPLSKSRAINQRVEIRRQSYREFKIFKRRWKNAMKSDECWVNPYPESIGQNIY